MVQVLQQEFAGQRSQLEAKVAQLESDLAQLRPSKRAEPSLASQTNTVPNSRRNLIKKMAVGMAGGAVLFGAGMTNVATNQAAQASTGTFDFNGTSSGVGINAASGNTSISLLNSSPTNGFPLLSIINGSTPTNQGSTPDQESVGLYASSSGSFAIYGYSPGGGSTPTAIIGVSGSDPVQQGSSILSNIYAGVVGSSTSNPGIAGLSGTNVGVQGVSLGSNGVQGKSGTGVGGAFASASSDINQGAALQLGVRTTAEGAPNNTYAHNQGEMVMDRYGRLYVSNAGNPAGASVPNPASQSPRASALPSGIINQHGGDWRFLAPMVVRAGSPAALSGTDNQLHVQGELWLDTTAGKIYVCTTTGTSNTQLRSTYNIAGNAVFASLAGGSGVTLLPAPERFIDSRGGANNLNDNNGSFTNAQARPYTITALVGKNGSRIPAYATGIIGIITVVGPTGGGFGAVTSNSNPPSTSNVNFNPGFTTAGSFFTALSPSGQIFVTLSVSAGAGQADLIIDIAGYFV